MIKTFVEKFGQSWSACMLVMVQGDVSVLTLSHAVTASKTGTLTGIAFVIAQTVPWTSKLLPIYLTGLLTAVADYIVHPGMFGAEGVEAITTGAVAMAIAVLYQRIFNT